MENKIEKIKIKILDDEIYLKAIEILEIENFKSNYFNVKTLLELFEDERAKIIIAQSQEKIVGYIIIYDNEDSLDIMKIAVKEKYKRENVGTMLLGFLKDKFNKNIFLEVRESNQRAIDFYIKNSFDKISIRKKYYKDNNENAIIMLYKKENN